MITGSFNPQGNDYIQLFMILMVYLIPSFVAYFRGHLDHNAIAVMNFFLGWTVLFWVWSLIWSLTGNTQFNANKSNGRKRSIKDAQAPSKGYAR